MSTATDITLSQFQALYEISRKVNSHLDLQSLLEEIMDLAVERLHAEKGLILFKEPGSDKLKVRVGRAMDQRSIQDVVAMSRSIIRQVGSEARPRILRRPPAAGSGELSDSVKRYGINSVLCVPLWERDQLYGVIYLDTTNRRHFFRDDDVPFLEAFANLVSLAIQNARSYAAVRSLNANLEKLVEQRTAELCRKHEELSAAYLELKNAQLQLVRSEKMASLARLVAGIAHEVNSPLGAITGSADVLARSVSKLKERLNVQNDETAGRILEALQEIARVNTDSCARVSRTVKAMRTFVRLDEDDFKGADIHEGLESALALLRPEWEGRIDIVREYGTVPPLWCWAGQLNQLFLNLLLNACEAISGKGVIRVCTDSQAGKVFVEVSDTGMGILPENLSKIFDPGFTTKGVGYGTGLGLAIAHRIAEEHGGSIEVESEPGKGTRFRVSLAIQHIQPHSMHGKAVRVGH